MKKLLETSLGKRGKTAFLKDEKKISWNKAIKLIAEAVKHPFVVKYVLDGSIVYMPQDEYEKIKIIIEEHTELKRLYKDLIPEYNSKTDGIKISS